MKNVGGGSHFAQFWCIVSSFRMNTCKSVSKQRTLTTFRMNTYEKRGGVGGVMVNQKMPPFTSPGRCPWLLEKRLLRLRSAVSRRPLTAGWHPGAAPPDGTAPPAGGGHGEARLQSRKPA